MGPDAMILVFLMLSFKPTFSLSSFTFIMRLFSSSSISAVKEVSSVYLSFDISPGNLDSSLWFIQPGILLDILCILVKKTGWQYTALSYCTELLYIIYRLGLLWCWMICLGNKLRSLCCFWVYTQVLHFGLLLTMKATPFLLRDSCPQ